MGNCCNECAMDVFGFNMKSTKQQTAAQPSYILLPQDPNRRLYYRNRLIAFYTYYRQIDKLPDVDNILNAFAGKEEEMFRSLVQKYGPEPPLMQPVMGVPQQEQPVHANLNYAPFPTPNQAYQPYPPQQQKTVY